MNTPTAFPPEEGSFPNFEKKWDFLRRILPISELDATRALNGANRIELITIKRAVDGSNLNTDRVDFTADSDFLTKILKAILERLDDPDATIEEMRSDFNTEVSAL